jgi:hypothetical protein
MEAKRSSETSTLIIVTRRHIPENDIFQIIFITTVNGIQYVFILLPQWVLSSVISLGVQFTDTGHTDPLATHN